jgi:hypothetical protein
LPGDGVSLDAGAFQLGFVLLASTWKRLERSTGSRESANTRRAVAFRVRRPFSAEALTFGRSFPAVPSRCCPPFGIEPPIKHYLLAFTICRTLGGIQFVGVETPPVRKGQEVLLGIPFWPRCECTSVRMPSRKAGRSAECTFQSGFFLSPERPETTGSVDAAIEQNMTVGLENLGSTQP